MISPEEATLIIKGWFESNSELLLSVSMINFSVYAKCRIVAVEDGRITLWSTKDDAVFSFSVDSPHLSLKYSEMRELSGTSGFENVSVPEDKQFNSALVVALPIKEIDSSFSGTPANVERVILMEL